MTASTLVARLRPGRDPNDTTWVVTRYLQDWRQAQSSGVAFDLDAKALVLAPLAVPELARSWLPLAAVASRDGTHYRSDPQTHRVLFRPACADEFVPLAGVGGEGFATGRFRMPLGVALDARDRLYVADSGNARVQVILAPAGRPAEVLAVLDHGLRDPVHVVVAPSGRIFVADRGTAAIHVFSDRFLPLGRLGLRGIDPFTGRAWAAQPAPLPLALALTAQGTLAVFDPRRAWLYHLDIDGEPLPALPWPGPERLPDGWPALPRQYAGAGEVLVGPLDAGRHDFAWHELLFDVELPAGTSITVQTHADNEPAPPARFWAPRDPRPIGSDAGEARREARRLVLGERDRWHYRRPGSLMRAQPLLHRFAGEGPVGTDRFELPAAVARRLRVGDRIELETPQGGRAAFAIVAIAAAPAQIVTSGDPQAFADAQSVHLLSSRRALPFGALDLDLLQVPLPVPGLPLATGASEILMLPHALASVLQQGDVIEARAPQASARLELLAPSEDPVEVRIDATVPGDFSAARLTLLDSIGRLVVRAELAPQGALPAGSTVRVLDDVHAESHPVALIEAGPVAGTSTIHLAHGRLAAAIGAASWTGVEFDAPQPTDRGRYLWLRIVMRGAPRVAPGTLGPPAIAAATPRIHAVRATGPRPSLTRMLPVLFSRRDETVEPPGAGFLERFLTLFEGRLTSFEAAYESIGRLLNPRAADAEWLDFVASWLNLAFDPSWPLARRRQLVIEGASLQAARGTPRALVRWLEIYTGAAVAVTEDFRRRPPAPIQLGARGALGIAPLGSQSPADEAIASRLAHRFRVALTLPADVDRQAALGAVRRIIDTMKPAHTRYTLDAGGLRAPRVGIDTVVDSIVIAGPAHTDPCACDPDDARPGAPRGHIDQRARGGVSGFHLGGRLGRGGAIERAHQGARHV